MTKRRMSVATWSLRERAVCRRAAGFADLLAQADLDVQVDVLEVVAEWRMRRARSRRGSLRGRARWLSASSPGMMPCFAEHAGVGDRACDVVAVEAAVVPNGGAVFERARVEILRGGAFQLAVGHSWGNYIVRVRAHTKTARLVERSDSCSTYDWERPDFVSRASVSEQ